jgi:acyl-CoA reductase-like NAD-dependent aldehyde dehydrogenase
MTTLVSGTPETVTTAVLAGEQAYQTDWRWRSPSERSQYLFRCADAFEPHRAELAELLCLENGKPYLDALAFDINFLIAVFRYFASLVDKLPSGSFFERGPINSTVIYEPFGVCAGILPFNWPPIHFGGKVAPALAAGNVMVIKPGDQAPLTVIRMCEIISEVLPRDVVQVVPGLGPDVPRALIEHNLVKMVSFTGSTVAGAKAAETASKSVTPMVLELGGKNAFVVFDDVKDLDKAVGAALEGAFFNKGEACTAASRILVQRGSYNEFCGKLATGVRKLRSGSGMDEKTHLGPQVSKAQQERVLGYLQKAKDLEKEGKCKIAAQGALPNDLDCKDGYFVPPTLIIDVARHLFLAQEEIFGVLVTVTPFETEDEAVEIVNESRYGLTSVIFSQNSERCWRFSKKVDVGLVFVNQYFRNLVSSAIPSARSSSC